MRVAALICCLAAAGWVSSATVSAQQAAVGLPPDVTVEATGTWTLRWVSGNPMSMSLAQRLRPAELRGRVIVHNHMAKPLKKTMLTIWVSPDGAAAPGATATARRAVMATAQLELKPPLAPGAEVERPINAGVYVEPNTDLSRMRSYRIASSFNDPMTSPEERLMKLWGVKPKPADGGAAPVVVDGGAR